MITVNPLNGVLPLDELFPSSSEMIHGNADLVKRAFGVIFCSMDLARTAMGVRGNPDVWAATFLAVIYGMKRDGEDAAGIRQVAGDLAMMSGTPQDIRLYSIFRRIEAAEKASVDPAGFRKRVSSVLRMLVDSQQEQTDMFTSEIWGCVRDAFAIYERLHSSEGGGIRFMYPAAGSLAIRSRNFFMDLHGPKYHHSSDESWESYVDRLWAGMVESTFPYLSAIEETPESSHVEKDGVELRDHRLTKALEGRYRFPEDFNADILLEVNKPFMTCGLFANEHGRRYRDMILQKDFHLGSYQKQHKGLMKAIRYSIPITVMPKDRFDRLLVDGEFKSCWQLPAEDWDSKFCDNPQAARAVNDMRLFGEKSGRVTYAMLVVSIDGEEMVNQNTQHLAMTYGGGNAVLVQFSGRVKEQASITWGDSFQNFVALPYSDETLAWLIEARFFLNVLRGHPMTKEILQNIHEVDDLWKSFMQMSFGQKHPYFEIQIHGRIGLDLIKHVDQAAASADETQVDLTPQVKDAIRNGNHHDSSLP